MRDRKDIDKKYTWDLDKIYSSSDLFDSDYNRVKDFISKLSLYEDNMMDSSSNFYNTLKLSFDIERIIDKLYVYANLSFDLDTSCNKKQEVCDRVSNLLNLYSKCSYFIVLSILKCDYDIIMKYYEEKNRLYEYEKCIRDIYRYKEHTLSDLEERVLSSFGKALGNSYDTYELFKDCDMSFDDIEDENGNMVSLDNSSYSLYIESRDRSVRERAFKGLYSEYKKYSNTLASLISSYMKELSTMASIRKYDSALSMSLFLDDVDIKVYNNLIDSVHNNIGYLYDYYALKKSILGYDELHLYDVYTPITSSYDRKFDYEEAKSIILKVLGVFGEEYVNKVREYLDSRIIDVYPTKNKRTGGYSSGSYDTDPYILLNYQDKYNDMSTLIHEMGHSMHSYYSRSYNEFQNSEYRIFVAEVASTVNELLLSHYMLENSNSKEERLFILNNLMELYKATIYRQTMFAEFERDISKIIDNDGALTSERLSNMYYDLNKFYFGDNVYIDDEIRYEWERIPHFYYDFYVYKYATGLSAASKIVDDILNKKDGAVSNYIEFLKCGSKLSPLESLKVASVDLTDGEVINLALKTFGNYVDIYKKEM